MGLPRSEFGGSARASRARKVVREIYHGILLRAVLTIWAIGAAAAPLALAAEAQSPAVTAARIAGDETRTRFIADLTGSLGFNVYILPDPFRAIVDLPELSFKLPQGIGGAGRGLVRAYRYGRLERNRARIVMDLTGPALIEKSFLVEPRDGQPARMVIDLVATDHATFAKLELPQEGEAKSEEVPTPRQKPPSASPPNDELTASIASKAAEDDANRRKVIVLDPGHGGLDPGASSRSGTLEKDVVLAFAKAVKDGLDLTQRYTVLLTRDGDTFISLADRVRFARKHRADLMIAIHADALRGPTVRGATVYTLSETASDAEAQALADKENGVDILAGVRLADDNEEIAGILIDLAQRETKNSSVFLARKLVRQLKPVTLLTGRPHRSAGFRVLKAPDVPSVLIELGYLSSRPDERLLTSADWRRKTAKATVAAVDSFFGGSATGQPAGQKVGNRQ